MNCSRLTSHVSRLTSHVSRLTSHVSRLTSHVTLIAIVCAIVTLAGAQLRGAECSSEPPYFLQAVRKSVGGTMQPFGVKLYLDASAQGNTNQDDWGSVTYYQTNEGNPGQENCVSPAKNCNDDDYSYAVVDISTNWSVTVPISGQNVTFTISDAEAYWDHKYDGYTKIGTIDYSMNSHGYAYGVGDWPDDDQYGVDVILECWQAANDECDATVAVAQNGHGHSIKLIGAECDDGYTSWCIHEASIEKFRESALYLQEGDCPGGVDIGKAHGSTSFDLYKP